MNAPDRFELFLLGEDEKRISEKIISGMANASDFTLKKEDHTIGNIVAEHLREHPHVLLAGYKVSHPNVPELFIRIQTDGTITPREALMETMRKLMKILDVLSKEFTREFELRRAFQDEQDNGQNGPGR